MDKAIEKQLLRRLKILGGILMAFAIGALLYNHMPDSSDDAFRLEEEITTDLEDPPPLNPFFVSAVFGLVGASCVFISWKKKKGLFSASTQNEDPE